MAFFADVKARLGLDISPFEKGLSSVQAKSKQAGAEVGKNFAGVKALIGFSAIAAGFKGALDKAKELRDAALETGTALDPSVQRTADLADNLDKSKDALADVGVTILGGLQRAVDYVVAFGSQMLGLVDGVSEGLAAIDEGRAKEAKAQADKKKAAEQAKTDAANQKKSDEAELAASVKAAAQFKKAGEIKEAARQKTLTLDQKIAETQAALAQAEKDNADTSKTAADRIDALVIKEQKRADLADLLKEKTDRQKQVEEELLSFFGDIEKSRADAEAKRTDELEAQQKTLLDQKKTIEQTLAAQEQGKRASVEDAASGKRNVGGRTQANAKRLLSDNAEERRRMDAVSQAEDTLAEATTSSGRRDARAELDRRKAALAATQGRKSSLEKSLGGKVSDSFVSKQVDELIKVNKALADTNKALAPTSIKSTK
jgi:hypothetical protein